MRVSDNTSVSSVNEALKRTRGRMERLQIQNATQKKIVTPSDDPAGNMKIMDVRTQGVVNAQFESNASLGKNRLAMTDAALGEMIEIFMRAKEIAISQSSEASASPDSRFGVAQEVSTLYKQAIAVANRRVGQHHLFGGYQTLRPPYDAEGRYFGDNGEVPVEIHRGVFVSVNIPGSQVFQVTPRDSMRGVDLMDRPQGGQDPLGTPGPGKAQDGSRGIASQASEKIDAFRELANLRVGLLTNDTITIRDTMEQLDDVLGHLIAMRSQVSSRVAGIDAAMQATQKIDQQNAEMATQLEDADYAELWSNLAKEETVLRSSLHAAQKLIQPSLVEFLR